MSVRYRDAGVDLEAAESITARITDRLGSSLFGGFLPVSQLKSYREPVLVTSIDGIGTKVRLAARRGSIEGLGHDIVHHCVNDIAVHGATPLCFLDYLAFHHLDPVTVERIVGSIGDACRALGIALAGGETAEMPLVYSPGHFDIAGTVVGAVEAGEIIDGSAIREGDLLLGLPSSGLHTNGYSLVQHLFSEEDYSRYHPDLGMTMGEALLIPHRCYLDDIRSLRAAGAVHGLAHITGGGIPGNLSRIVPDGLTAVVDLPTPPPLFRYLEEAGVPVEEMRRVFNLGIGLIAVCDPSIGSPSVQHQIIGAIERGAGQKGRVHFRDCD
jgi:phosphoribosylformylglycinamidine cyclo-ligase